MIAIRGFCEKHGLPMKIQKRLSGDKKAPKPIMIFNRTRFYNEQELLKYIKETKEYNR